jgi:hypothetical protein
MKVARPFSDERVDATAFWIKSGDSWINSREFGNMGYSGFLKTKEKCLGERMNKVKNVFNIRLYQLFPIESWIDTQIEIPFSPEFSLAALFHALAEIEYRTGGGWEVVQVPKYFREKEFPGCLTLLLRRQTKDREIDEEDKFFRKPGQDFE